MAQSVFDFGQRGRARESARLQMESSLASYRETVIRAFNDIEVALGNIELLESLGQVLLEDLTRAEESLRIAEVRYREGVIDHTTVSLSSTARRSTTRLESLRYWRWGISFRIDRGVQVRANGMCLRKRIESAWMEITAY